MNAESDGRTLTLFDCSSIQSYLFESSGLAENLGASELVRVALEAWLLDALQQHCSVVAWDDWRAKPNLLALDAAAPPDAEVIFNGGGNAAVLLESSAVARAVVRTWSERLLLEAHGLRGAAVHEGAPSGGLAAAIRRAQAALASYKRSRRPQGLPLRLPIARACNLTGLAANTRTRPPGEQTDWIYIARSADRKRAARDRANRQLTDDYRATVVQDGYEFTDQLDHLGGSRGSSHIAVVHIDGNGIGRRLEQVVAQDRPDAEAAQALRAISRAAGDTVAGAVRKTIELLRCSLGELEAHGMQTEHQVREHGAWKRRRIFPLRPVVVGGDDVTFICDGRIGLPLAAAFLTAFSGEDDGAGGKLAACAGVAIVPAHFPFRRAYDLAESLVRRAKEKAREWREARDDESSWLDFDLSFGGSLAEPAARRGQAEERLGYALVHRPWRVWPAGDEDWSEFETILERFQDREVWPRSRAKALRDALAGGEDEVDALKQQFSSRGFDRRFPRTGSILTGLANKTDYGKYYDALELLDFYLPLTDGELAGAAAAGGRVEARG